MHVLSDLLQWMYFLFGLARLVAPLVKVIKNDTLDVVVVFGFWDGFDAVVLIVVVVLAVVVVVDVVVFNLVDVEILAVVAVAVCLVVVGGLEVNFVTVRDAVFVNETGEVLFGGL
jgi:hypothetical protein